MITVFFFIDILIFGFISGIVFAVWVGTDGEEEPTQTINQKIYDDAYELGRWNGVDALKNELLKLKSKDEYPIVCIDAWTIEVIAENVKGV